MVKILGYNYEKSTGGELVQGDARKIRKYKKNGYKTYAGSNGSLIMGKNASVNLLVDGDGVKKILPGRMVVEEKFPSGNFSEKKVKNFIEACKDEKVNLKYTEGIGLHL